VDDLIGECWSLEIEHKHGGFNINYQKATVVWQQFGSGNLNSSDNPVCLSVQLYGTYCQVLFVPIRVYSCLFVVYSWKYFLIPHENVY
jgi:hypothetical protein